jgi:putative PIN family toxin of toxin-antitoxin system
VITLDTNVYVSALNFGGRAMVVLDVALSGEIGIATSEPIPNETLRVLHEKFNWLAADLEAARNLILTCTQLVHPRQKLAVITEDPSDNRILECALESGAD